MMPAQLASVRRRIGPTAYGDVAAARPRRGPAAASTSPARGDDFDLPIDHPGKRLPGASLGASCRRIPYGETIAYRELAERVDAGAAWRAVGRANGSNRLAVIVPCHRVIATGGGLGGYGGGLRRQAAAARPRGDRSARDVW